ncbi:hypothetical protein C7C45_04925 [Micromonospora arborensis]|uniref:Uncharacterized protein n=1 Tax=Micromonospora arborensis TaxID=2116518 RepID=A0A318NPG1_9ACTN|nr:hypothetical protein [Micromonospora arborensis]PYC75214.1 hypothetical protein C7C45_04925 [Micromonospora arborensis]
MTDPIVISVSKPLWTAWATDRKLARISRPGLAQLSTEQLESDLAPLEEAAKDGRVEVEVVYGLWMDGSQNLPRPITKYGLVAEDELYALGETPEEAAKNAQEMRARTLVRIRTELAQRA